MCFFNWHTRTYALCATFPTPIGGGVWSFYIFSSGSRADELFFRDFELEFFQEFGVFVHFLA